MIEARRIVITRARTEPVQIGYHPRKVKISVKNSAENETEVPTSVPFVAIRTEIIPRKVKLSEKIIPASVAVVPNAAAIALSHPAHTTMTD